MFCLFALRGSHCVRLRLEQDSKVDGLCLQLSKIESLGLVLVKLLKNRGFSFCLLP